MTAPPFDPPAGLSADPEPAIPRGAEPESAIAGPIAGRYDLGERIAKGGMGIVYRAHDRLLNRTVAVKVMRSRFLHRGDLLRRFLAEARISARLQHPGIVPVYEVGTLADTRPFIAMKLIEGRTLARLLRDRPTPAHELAHFLKVFEAFCQTIAYAHQQGVIHRDLKPDNVMVGAFGEVQVMDWGLAKYLDPAMAADPIPDGFDVVERSAFGSHDGLTQPTTDHPTEATAVVPVSLDSPCNGFTSAGEILGTIAYMPPEQARGHAAVVDRRGDVFALGAILCQILTGHPPYFGPPDVMRENARNGRLFGAYVLLDRSCADPSLVRLAKHCLEAEPQNRPADAGVLTALVAECLEGLQDRSRALELGRLTAEARLAEVEARERLSRRARRLARVLAVFGVLTAGVLTAGIGWYANERTNRDADDARRWEGAGHQIESAMDEAHDQDELARTGPGGPVARHAAAAQAVSACRRAEALFAAAPGVKGELHDQFAELKRQVAETERGTRLAVALDHWRADILGRGTFDPALSACQCKTLFAEHGFDVLAMDASAGARDLQAHPAGASVRAALSDWLAITPSAAERQHIAAILRASGDQVSAGWLAALEANDLDSLTRVADDPAESIPAVSMVVAARRLLKADRMDAAVRLLTRGVRRYPCDFALNSHLGTLLRTTPTTRTEAIGYLTVALAARPSEPGAALELGLALADAGRDDEAIDVLRTAMKADRDSAARYQLARLLARRGDESALVDLTSVVLARPDDPEARAAMGEALLQLGRFRQAAAALREAADLSTDDAARRDELRALARSATRMGALEDRIADVLAGHVIPTTPCTWADLGEVCRRTKRYATAARFFARAADADATYRAAFASCAALAGFGRGVDAGNLSDAERAELRRAALPELRRASDSIRKDWLLRSLDDPRMTDMLPAAEREGWRRLWSGT
jgi:eukaryotic-like serine/threonine-protein kinase